MYWRPKVGVQWPFARARADGGALSGGAIFVIVIVIVIVGLGAHHVGKEAYGQSDSLAMWSGDVARVVREAVQRGTMTHQLVALSASGMSALIWLL